MKFLTTILVILIAGSAYGQNRTPIRRGYLQTNLNGNQQSITNVNQLIANSAIFTNTVLATNYTMFMPQWVDMLGQMSLPSASSAPVLTAVTNSSVIKLPAFQWDDEAFFTFQMPHNIATTNSLFQVGTAPTNWHIEPHIHFSINGNGVIDATHSNVTFECQWQIGNLFGQFISGTNTVTSGVTAKNVHYLAELGAITNGAPFGISAIFHARIARIQSPLRDVASGVSTRDVTLEAFDLHTPVGNVTILGSRDETSQ